MSYLKSSWLIIACIVLTFAFVFGYARSYIKHYNVNKEIALLAEEQRTLENERIELSTLFKSVQNTEYAEEQAREKFGLRKPGENVVVIKKKEDVETELKVENSEQKISNPMLWWLYFFGQKKTSS